MPVEAGVVRLALMAGSYDERRDGISVYIENLLAALLRLAAERRGQRFEIHVFGCPGALDTLAATVAQGAAVDLHTHATRGSGRWSQIFGLSYQAWRAGPFDLTVLPNLQPLLLPGRKLSILHDLTYRVAREHFSRRRFYYMDGLTRLRLRSDAAMGVISQTTRAQLLGNYPASRRQRLLLLPNGLPQSKLGERPARAQARARIGAGDLQFVFCGRLNRLKGVDRMLSLARALDQEAATRGIGNVTLHLVGKNTPESDALLRGWQFQFVTVRRHGYLSDAGLNQCYRDSGFALFLSRNEGFGLPLIEAMWMGAVPLVSDIPVFAEILGAGYPRFGGDAIGIRALLDFIQRLREEPDYRERILDHLDSVLRAHEGGYEHSARRILDYAVGEA